jgi:flagellar hook protein FlgE
MTASLAEYTAIQSIRKDLKCQSISIGTGFAMVVAIWRRPWGACRLAVGEEVMGIFGALTTAVTGMRAQSFALENVSGNIANSQTTAFKRMDTSFVDLIPDEIPSKQLSGSVVANARMTNTVQGDIQSSTIGTYMAINGDGFFVVQKPSNFTDNQPVFDGIDRYTRRGDFQPDKNGFLVNGAGYYLMGIPVDPATGNLVGSVPQLLQFQNDFLPAQATTQIEYRVNLAEYPDSAPNADPDIPRSELLNPAAFSSNPIAGAPTAARITGFGAQLADVIAGVSGTGTFANPAVDTLGANNGTLTITVTDSGGVPTDYNVVLGAGLTLNDIVTAINGTAGLNAAVTASVDTSGGTNKLRIVADNADIDFQISAASTDVLTTRLGLEEGVAHLSENLLDQGVSQGETLSITVGASNFTLTFGTGVGQISTVAELQAELAANYPPGMGTATVDANGNLSLVASAGNEIDVDPSTTAVKFGMNVFHAVEANGTVRAQDLTAFIDQSIGGGAVTAFDISGSPVNIQLRWAKVDSAEYGGTDTWNLFYQIDSNATGEQSAWQNVGVNYRFGDNGQMDPTIASLTLSNVTVNGVALGDVQLVHGSGGVTQFADANGNAKVNILQQNGFPAGELEQVSVSDKGRIVGSYSNGRTIDLAEITLANFNGANYLKRIDGGAFEVTDESGPAIYGAPGTIVGASLEGSNTDIADEFTKLIITQQAYSANTRVITSANQMVQDLLNMLR